MSLSEVPECARACVISAADSTPCTYGDVLCVCSASGWFQNFSCCIQPLCSAADIATTIALADAECDIVGVSIPKALECSNPAPISSSISIEVVVSTVAPGSAATATGGEVATAVAGGPQTETVVASGTGLASTIGGQGSLSTTTGPIVETFTTGILVGGTSTPTSGFVAAGGQTSGTGSGPSPTASPSSSGLSQTATIGIGVGVGVGVLLLAIIAFLAFCLFRKRRRDNLANNTEGVAGVEVFDVGEDKSGARARLAAA